MTAVAEWWRGSPVLSDEIGPIEPIRKDNSAR